MTGSRTPGRVSDAVRAGALGFVLGLALGVVDGALVLHAEPALAGAFLRRLGTMAVALAIDGVALAGVFIAAALVVPVLRRPTSRVAIGALAGGAAVAVFAAVAIAWVGPDGRSDDGTDRPNVLLISIDTLRPDRLSVYGHDRETSPRLDGLARSGVLFEQARSTASWTLPAHASMLTGLEAMSHGAIGHRDALSTDLVTLAERFRDAGYWTGAWVGTDTYGYVGADFAFDQGFALYAHQRLPRRHLGSLLARRLERAHRRIALGFLGNAEVQVDAMVDWLEGQRRTPFFAFLHLYDVHSRFEGLPYRAPEPFSERFCGDTAEDYDGCADGKCASDRLAAMTAGAPPPPRDEIDDMLCHYDGAIAYVDAELGRLFDRLEALGLADRTIVVVTSDHGEAFFEHGLPLHVTLHEEVGRIPLIIRAPGVVSGKRATGSVGLVDLAPTILELAGLDPMADVDGVSLASDLLDWRGRTDRPRMMVTSEASATALVEGRFKLIETRSKTGAEPVVELFDLEADREERRDRVRVDSDRAMRMRRALRERLAQAEARRARHAGEALEIEPSERQRDELRALGYSVD